MLTEVKPNRTLTKSFITAIVFPKVAGDALSTTTDAIQEVVGIVEASDVSAVFLLHADTAISMEQIKAAGIMVFILKDLILSHLRLA